MFHKQTQSTLLEAEELLNCSAVLIYRLKNSDVSIYVYKFKTLDTNIFLNC